MGGGLDLWILGQRVIWCLPLLVSNSFLVSFGILVLGGTTENSSLMAEMVQSLYSLDYLVGGYGITPGFLVLVGGDGIVFGFLVLAEGWRWCNLWTPLIS